MIWLLNIDCLLVLNTDDVAAEYWQFIGTEHWWCGRWILTVCSCYQWYSCWASPKNHMMGCSQAIRVMTWIVHDTWRWPQINRKTIGARLKGEQRRLLANCGTDFHCCRLANLKAIQAKSRSLKRSAWEVDRQHRDGVDGPGLGKKQWKHCGSFMATTDQVCPSCKVAATKLGAEQLSSGCAPPSRNSTRDTINCVAQEALRVATVNMVDHNKCSLARVHKVSGARCWMLRVCWCWMLTLWLLNVESLLVLNAGNMAAESWESVGAECWQCGCWMLRVCECWQYGCWRSPAHVACVNGVGTPPRVNGLGSRHRRCFAFVASTLEVFVVCRSNTSKVTKILSKPSNRWSHRCVRFQDL